jgi:O-antigen ligase
VLTYSSGFVVFALALVPLVIATELITGRFRWPRTTLTGPMLGLAAVSVVSALLTRWPELSRGSTSTFLLFLIVTVYSVSWATRAGSFRVARLVETWIAGAAVAAVWGLARSQPTLPLGASTPGLVQTTLGTTLSAGIALTLGALSTRVPAADTHRRRVTAALLLLVLIALMAALELTWSRGAWIGGAVGVAAFIALSARWRVQIAVLTLCALAVATVALGPRRAALSDRLWMIPDTSVNANRIELWGAALRMLADHPLLGTGFGTFAEAWRVYRPAGRPTENTAHNLLLNFAAEAGVLGLVAFSAFVGVGARGLWWRAVASRGDPSTHGLWVALLCAIIAILTQSLFDAGVTSVHVAYGLVALLAIGGAQSRREQA